MSEQYIDSIMHGATIKKFITVFTRARHWYSVWVILIHFNIIFNYAIVSFMSSLSFMISSHNPVSIHFLSMLSKFLAHLILLGLIILMIIFDEEYKSWKLLIMKYSVFFYYTRLGLGISLSILFSNTLSLCHSSLSESITIQKRKKRLHLVYFHVLIFR